MAEPQRVAADEIKRRLDDGGHVIFLDARADDAWQKATEQIPESRRVPPDDVDSHIDGLPKDALIVTYCT